MILFNLKTTYIHNKNPKGKYVEYVEYIKITGEHTNSIGWFGIRIIVPNAYLRILDLFGSYPGEIDIPIKLL